jgi:hypothetical protein
VSPATDPFRARLFSPERLIHLVRIGLDRAVKLPAVGLTGSSLRLPLKSSMTSSRGTGSSARTDLRGGGAVMTVSTKTRLPSESVDNLTGIRNQPNSD